MSKAKYYSRNFIMHKFQCDTKNGSALPYKVRFKWDLCSDKVILRYYIVLDKTIGLGLIDDTNIIFF